MSNRALKERDLTGRVGVVTGITSGIGGAVARALAARGAHVVAVARSPERGERAVRAIRASVAGAELTLMICDLASQASIRRFAGDLRARFPAVHALVNNAGAIVPERQLTEDRIEAIFATNHLGPFLLTRLLLDPLRAGAPARVVNVASEAHRRGFIDFGDLQLERRYSPVRAYCNAKLADVLFTFELSRRLEGAGVTANCLHPGAVATTWGDAGSLPVRLAWRIARPFFLNADEGARGPVHLAASPELEGVTGRYFVRTREARPAPQASDTEAARRLWAASEELVGLEPGLMG